MELKFIHKCNNEFEAEQIRELLEQNGIICQMTTKLPNSLFPLTIDGFGQVKISVMEEDALRAKEIIEHFLSVPESSFIENDPAFESEDQFSEV